MKTEIEILPSYSPETRRLLHRRMDDILAEQAAKEELPQVLLFVLASLDAIRGTSAATAFDHAVHPRPDLFTTTEKIRDALAAAGY